MERDNLEDIGVVRDEIIKFLIDNTPVTLDLEKQEFTYDKTSIYYKTFRYIKELEKSDK